MCAVGSQTTESSVYGDKSHLGEHKAEVKVSVSCHGNIRKHAWEDEDAYAIIIGFRTDFRGFKAREIRLKVIWIYLWHISHS